MTRTQKLIALTPKIIATLSADPRVQGCTLYGSLAEDRADDYSDIDLWVDVSGSDNGRFMLEFADAFGPQLGILWVDYAPSLAPGQYVVSAALDADDPFCFADINCTATPHCATVTRDMVRNDPCTHLLKLWVINAKHWLRGSDCHADICRMAARIGIDTQGMTDVQLLRQVLTLLEGRCPAHLRHYIASCRAIFEVHI